uniref:Reverse transcriptase domain-containing protein n=1 Tax=Graphocephala atropunctata TaxID=36148 RepID=A0A1B6LLW5_9HEMI
MYADDTTLLLQHKTALGLHSAITNSTEKALHYCLQNDLAINPSKTTQLNFSRRHEQIPEVPNILVENYSKLLGMTIDANLTWTEHVNTLSKKLRSGIFVVRRIKWIAGQEAAKAAYYALVESHIRYGLAVWGGTSQQNLERILILQKKAIRTLANLTPTESCRDAFKSLRILTVIALYIHSVVVYIDQAELTRGENIHSYNTRRAADYLLPAHHTTQYSRKPSYIGRKVFNSLPQNLKTIKGQQLKQQLQDWLMERPFYSMEEYFDAR